MLRILALDQATTTGWHCAGQGGSVCFARRKPLSDKTIERHADVGDRFSTWLSSMIDTYQPAILVLEAVPPRGRSWSGRTANVSPLAYGLRMAAGIVAFRHDLILREFTPQKWQGWAKKRGWTKAAKGDEADARWLHDYAAHELLPRVLEAA